MVSTTIHGCSKVDPLMLTPRSSRVVLRPPSQPTTQSARTVYEASLPVRPARTPDASWANEVNAVEKRTATLSSLAASTANIASKSGCTNTFFGQ